MTPEAAEWFASITLGQVAAWSAAVTGVGLAIWKGWPAFRKVVGLLAASIKLVDTLSALPDDLAFIKHELDVNSGKSVKDTTIRTEAAVLKLVDDIGHVRRQNAALKTSVANVNRRLDKHIAASQQRGNDA